MKTVVVVSGGLDSVTLAHHLAHSGHELTVVSFDYGQRHSKELLFAQACAKRLGVEYVPVDARPLQSVLAGSSLTDTSIEVPEGHYAEESMKSTVVPNRNAIMISIAAGLVISRKANALAVGVHGGDHFVYPDCRPGFVRSMETTLLEGNEGFIDPDFKLLAPFIDGTKTDIVRRGAELDVPWEQTWSCYKGAEHHCGLCGTCVERREAFTEAGVVDPTFYQPGDSDS